LFSIDFIRSASNGSPDRVDALVWGLTKIFDKITGRRLTTKGLGPDQEQESHMIDWESTDAAGNGWMAH
jgi:hypothetical protein